MVVLWDMVWMWAHLREVRWHLRDGLVGDSYSRAYRGVAQESFLAVRSADVPLLAFLRIRELGGSVVGGRVWWRGGMMKIGGQRWLSGVVVGCGGGGR